MVRNEGAKFMNTEYTAVIKQEGEWWIGWIEEIPGINCQEATRDELTETLRITLREAIELNRSDAVDAAGSGYTKVKIAV
jgi:predicted RNase H-like HicB family nuclease